MGQKVLLADDSITVQKIVKLSLTEEGIEVIAVGNGEQAVHQLETLQPDLVMADVFMPGKDGYEVCEFVKAQPHLKHIPVILLVHAFEPFDPDRAKKVGADHQLTKPFQSIRTLVTTVRDLLQSSSVTAELPEATATPASVSAPPVQAVMTAPVPSPSVTKVPDEEFAVVSSLPSVNGANLMAEDAVVSTSGIATTPLPISLASTPTTAMNEANLPIPLPHDGELSNVDLLPPAELPVLPSAEWQNTALPNQTAWESALSSPSHTVNLEPSPLSFAPVSLAANPTPLDNSTDDVLELADVLLSDSDGISMAHESPQAGQFSPEVPLLAVLGSVPETTEEPLISFAQPEPLSSSLAASFDVGTGQIEALTETLPRLGESFAQDVKVGTLPKTEGNATAYLSEEMIEEIVNRVVQRLSTKAIQEIAWEVVPEMAELLLRKQILQQKQLTH